MKQCYCCGEVKPLEEFSRNRTKPDGRQAKCRSCHAIYIREHYRKNKQYYMENTARTKKRRKAEVVSYIQHYLESHPCVDCGECDPIVLEFDHVRGQKSGNVSTLVHHDNLSLTRVMAEIEKCDVRCANCHRRRTASQLAWSLSARQVELEERRLLARKRAVAVGFLVEHGEFTEMASGSHKDEPQ